ncbi:MAG: hypothetical protein U0T82_13780 [Bacteroidales bacterium]
MIIKLSRTISQMRIWNHLIIISFILFFTNTIFSQTPTETDKNGKLPQGSYISINPFSLSAFIPSVLTKEYLPYIYNLESGVSLASGNYFKQLHLEGRVVLGSPSALIFCPQLHAGIRYFPFTNKEKVVIPLGFGIFIRSWDTYYTHSKIHFYNLAPHPNISYLVKVNKFFIDFRIGWDFAVATWSNLEHSSPKADFTKFPPIGSINIVYSF